MLRITGLLLLSVMTFFAEFPFTLTVKNVGRSEKITCPASLRKVPGNRGVFDGLSGDRLVIIKLFFDPRRAGVHRERKWQGLKRLQSLGMKTPAPLFYGQDEYCRQVIIIEKIQHASTLKELWPGTDDPAEKMKWLRLLFRKLADYHLKGILQHDLHLGNFILKDLELITLDPAQMKFQGKPVGRGQAIAQLALLCSRIDGINLKCL